MPELAEVEYYRRQWNLGLGGTITAVKIRRGTRLLRGTKEADPERSLTKGLLGGRLLSSHSHGKQMLFLFGNVKSNSKSGSSLGIHLGMTGFLRKEKADFLPGIHDHLVLYQKNRSLVFADPRRFGRLKFLRGIGLPAWWKELPPPVLSAEFTVCSLSAFLRRRAASPLKAILLDQSIFPGIGNWMADEILWQCRLHPGLRGGAVDEAIVQSLWRVSRQVCRTALRLISPDWSDLPTDWLFPHRWKDGDFCPRDGTALKRSLKSFGGRTSCWCPHCQVLPLPAKRRRKLGIGDLARRDRNH